MHLATVSASLFSIATISAYFVKASVMHKTYCLPWLLILRGPKRSKCTLWFIAVHCGSGCKRCGFGLSSVRRAWHRWQPATSWVISLSMDGQKYDWSNLSLVLVVPSCPVRMLPCVSANNCGVRDLGTTKTVFGGMLWRCKIRHTMLFLIKHCGAMRFTYAALELSVGSELFVRNLATAFANSSNFWSLGKSCANTSIGDNTFLERKSAGISLPFLYWIKKSYSFMICCNLFSVLVCTKESFSSGLWSV